MLEELSRAVRDKAVSAEELVRVSLERIERLNPPINAVDPSSASKPSDEARALDGRDRSG